MTNLIVDCGVSVMWFLTETYSPQADLILGEYEQGRAEFLAPALIWAEFGNVMWKKQIFQNIAQTETELAVKEFKKINFTLIPTTVLFDEAYQIAVKYRRTFYDSLYLALSVRENCQFVTADERLYNAVKADLPNVVRLANWK